MKKLLNTLYVTNPEAYVCKSDDNLAVRLGDEQVMKLPFHLLESLIVIGHLGCSAAVMGECAKRGITISFLDDAGRFMARVEGAVSGNVLLRRAQYRLSDDKAASLSLAQRFIAGKLRNSKVVVQRYMRDYPESCGEDTREAIALLARSEERVFSAATLDELRGIEGDAAHVYFSAFGSMIRVSEFSFSSRSKRPPRDPVNAMLSFFYSILSRDIVSVCEAVGLDPQVGFLHRDRPGRASLSLDLMEELRAYCVDRFVLSAVNRRQVSPSDFEPWGGGVAMKADARKTLLSLWQKRKQEQITHPFLAEKIELGLLPFVQAQLLARAIRGDLEDYPAFLWR